MTLHIPFDLRTDLRGPIPKIGAPDMTCMKQTYKDTCRLQNPDIPRAGQGGAAHGNALGRGGARQDRTPTVRSAQEKTILLAPQEIEDNCPEGLFGSTNKRNPMQTDGRTTSD